MHRVQLWQAAAVGWGVPAVLSVRALVARLLAAARRARAGVVEPLGACWSLDEQLDSLTIIVIIVIISVSSCFFFSQSWHTLFID